MNSTNEIWQEKINHHLSILRHSLRHTQVDTGGDLFVLFHDFLLRFDGLGVIAVEVIVQIEVVEECLRFPRWPDFIVFGVRGGDDGQRLPSGALSRSPEDLRVQFCNVQTVGLRDVSQVEKGNALVVCCVLDSDGRRLPNGGLSRRPEVLGVQFCNVQTMGLRNVSQVEKANTVVVCCVLNSVLDDGISSYPSADWGRVGAAI